ncbi:ATP-binding cassette domain-containing protein [Aquibacillus halophilus]|uniref:ATP-binding cassette domain-containing protein n=1 Tax=Aquibacillus halophilus TaxID=930132 RepID=A0A6A8DMB1_9BACI|nr:ABC transporter ATP-binding protein [Aquibacillus halophilus]MRH44157.1 ATP-binding cassette domain-containing protein [Aquibacillus halophilus]
MKVIECNQVSKVYGNHHAVDQLSFTIEENKITGLIGRNGAGKTTLLKIIAGYLRKTSGEMNVFSEEPFNNLKVSANMIFVDDQMNFPTALNLGELLKAADSFYENWDMELAKRLFDYFSLNPKQRHDSLSKGMKSTFNMIVGLASRCSLTIFDEPTTGMDVSVRKDFYRALLKDYIAYPRTIILSSHLLNEIEDILEDILLIKDGEKYLHMSVSDVKEYAVGISGEGTIVNQWTKENEILYKKSLGTGSSYVVVKNDFTESMLERAKLAGLKISPVAAEDLCIYLTSKTNGGIDDVFDRS